MKYVRINLVVIIALLMGLSLLPTPIYAEKIKQVEVVNDESNPIPIGQPVDVNVMNGGAAFPREFFQRRASLSVENMRDDADFFTVPKGNRWGIETISIRANLPADDIYYFYVQTSVAGNLGDHYFPLPEPVSEHLLYFQDVHQVRIYADPETFVTTWFYQDNPEGHAGLTVTFSGYFLPVDSPTLSL